MLIKPPMQDPNAGRGVGGRGLTCVAEDASELARCSKATAGATAPALVSSSLALSQSVATRHSTAAAWPATAHSSRFLVVYGFSRQTGYLLKYAVWDLLACYAADQAFRRCCEPTARHTGRSSQAQLMLLTRAFALSGTAISAEWYSKTQR